MASFAHVDVWLQASKALQESNYVVFKDAFGDMSTMEHPATLSLLNPASTLLSTLSQWLKIDPDNEINLLKKTVTTLIDFIPPRGHGEKHWGHSKRMAPHVLAIIKAVEDADPSKVSDIVSSDQFYQLLAYAHWYKYCIPSAANTSSRLILPCFISLINSANRFL
jgi:hypothetical protein